MNTHDILERIVRIHNCLIQIAVSGDGAILMAESITQLRALAQSLTDSSGGGEEKEEIQNG